jgi:hypothetical protein
VAEVKKGADGTFKCTCGKGFRVPWSLQRHAKGCNGESAEPCEEEAEAELMDSDVSELMDVDGRVIPVDCVGAVILVKSADCRG